MELRYMDAMTELCHADHTTDPGATSEYFHIKFIKFFELITVTHTGTYFIIQYNSNPGMWSTKLGLLESRYSECALEQIILTPQELIIVFTILIKYSICRTLSNEDETRIYLGKFGDGILLPIIKDSQ